MTCSRFREWLSPLSPLGGGERLVLATFVAFVIVH